MRRALQLASLFLALCPIARPSNFTVKVFTGITAPAASSVITNTGQGLHMLTVLFPAAGGAVNGILVRIEASYDNALYFPITLDVTTTIYTGAFAYYQVRGNGSFPYVRVNVVTASGANPMTVYYTGGDQPIGNLLLSGDRFIANPPGSDPLGTYLITTADAQLPNAITTGLGTTAQLLHGNAGGNFAFGSVVNADLGANAVDSSKMAVVNTRRVCSMIVGADNGTALVDADLGPQGQQCKVAFAATVAEIDVNADAGTPSVIARKKHCATFAAGVCTSWTSTDLLSSALAAHASNFDACANTGGTTGLDGGTTCAATLQNTTLAIGDWIELKSGTAGGTAKRVSVDVIYTVN